MEVDRHTDSINKINKISQQLEIRKKLKSKRWGWGARIFVTKFQTYWFSWSCFEQLAKEWIGRFLHCLAKIGSESIVVLLEEANNFVTDGASKVTDDEGFVISKLLVVRHLRLTWKLKTKVVFVLKVNGCGQKVKRKREEQHRNQIQLFPII